MRLVLIHGWGFGPAVWDDLCAALPGADCLRLDLGFFAQPVDGFSPQTGDMLVGHSLGLMGGLTQYSGWAGFISINGFARFASRHNEDACAPMAALKAMKLGLRRDPAKVVQNFYKAIDFTGDLPGAPNAARLSTGLDLLCDGELKAITLPGLILAGRADPLVPMAASKRLAQLTPQAECVWAEGGHLLPLSHAAWCAQHIHTWMAHCG